MDDAYIGTIFAWAPNFAPANYAFCQGQILAIAQNQALFSLIGTIYGGNGSTNFALPNLSGRTPVGAGQSPGTSVYVQGARSGQETVTLLPQQMPVHTHAAQGLTIVAYNVAATDSTPVAGQVLAQPNTQVGINVTPTKAYAAPGAATPVSLASQSIAGNTAPAGASNPVSVMQPYSVIQWIICMAGLYPPRS